MRLNGEWFGGGGLEVESGGFSWSLLALEGCESDLGGVEELVCLLLWNRINEDAVGYAGDEVTNVFAADEWGQGLAVGGTCALGCDSFVVFVAWLASQVCLIGAPEGRGAALDGGLGLFGGGVDRWLRNGLDVGGVGCGFRCWFWCHGGSPYG